MMCALFLKPPPQGTQESDADPDGDGGLVPSLMQPSTGQPTTENCKLRTGTARAVSLSEGNPNRNAVLRSVLLSVPAPEHPRRRVHLDHGFSA